MKRAIKKIAAKKAVAKKAVTEKWVAKKAPQIIPESALQKLTIQANRIHQEKGDFLMPQIVDYISNKKWIDPRPIYQRRLVWNDCDKSLFLESIFLNLPVPPLFLFEKKYGEWEIMDGQQRSSAIVDFYDGSLRLEGLQRASELNGKTYTDFPDLIRRSFDRRRIQVITIVAGSEQFTDFDLRKEVFERLNTGGSPLNHQEIRNCLYAGPFCDLLDELSSVPVFTRMLKIPEHANPREIDKFPDDLLKNKMFRRMIDCEMVLRFFAFNEPDFLTNSIRKSLDNCMEYYHDKDPSTMQRLREGFSNRIDLVHRVFGDDAFLVSSHSQPAKKLFDALMAAVGNFPDKIGVMMENSTRLQQELKSLIANEESYEILITQHDSRENFQSRTELVSEAILRVIK